MSRLNARSLQFFTLLNSIWGIVIGLIGPFYAVYIAKISGGLDKLGIAFSIMIFIQSLTSYLIGRFSDKLGRKPFLFLIAYTDAAILFSFTLVSRTYQIYILQGLLGITNAMSMTIRGTLLADLTKKEKRGTEIGKFNAVVSVFSAAGMALGGYFSNLYGLKSLFYFAAAVITISTVLLFFISEPEET